MSICGKCKKKYKSYIIFFSTNLVTYIEHQGITEKYGDRICKKCRYELMGVKDKRLLGKLLKQKDMFLN